MRGALLLAFAGIMCVACSRQTAEREWFDLNYANDDSVYHNLDIRLPDDGKSPHKAIMVIYGSAWFGNNLKQAAFEAFGSQLLESGFAVVTINHRSSSDAAYPAQIHDVKAAIRFVRANADKYRIDGSFIGITGYSSGGHLASLAGASNGVHEFAVGETTVDLEGSVGVHTSVSSDVQAVVDWFAPIDMTIMNHCESTKDANSPEGALIRGNPADNPDLLALLNPVTFLDEGDPLFLVIHGDADNIVPPCQSELFAKALEEKGLLAAFISVPGGEHGPVTFNEHTFREMIGFFLKESEKK